MKSRASGFSAMSCSSSWKILSTLSQSVSISFQCSWSPTTPSPPVHCRSPVEPECQVYQGRYSLRGLWGVCLCVGRCDRPAQLLPLRHPPWGEQSLPILSKAYCIISFWNGWLTLSSPFHCPEVQICSLVPGPLPHHDWSWKIIFLCLLKLCYVSCEKS